MKTNRVLAVTLLLGLFCANAPAAPLGTAFTYQGRLNDGTNAANNLYDLDFALFDVPVGGSQLGLGVTLNGHPVSNGLFTVTLDFGASLFNGEARWLQIQVRTNGARITPWTVLSPRQALTPSPYALYAPSAGTALAAAVGSVSNLSLAPGAVTSDKIADGAITGADLSPLLASNTFWRLGGNAGTSPIQFLGTTDSQPMEMWVNGRRALRLEPGPNGTPNVVGGSVSNRVAAGVSGGTIGGGGDSSGGANLIAANYGSIGGGIGNLIVPFASESTIGGGSWNMVFTNAYRSTISGGSENAIQEQASGSSIGGGAQNTIEMHASDSTISGGYDNAIQVQALRSTIGGGEGNRIQSRASASTIAGGGANLIGPEASYSTIAGGVANDIDANAAYSTISGGVGNNIRSNAQFSTISGGNANTIQSNTAFATVPGGLSNLVAGDWSLAAGRRAQARHDGTLVWADASSDAAYASTGTNQFCVRAAGGVQLSPSTSLYCGSQVRQMLNLWSTNYGIGVQAGTLYFRASDDTPGNAFAWYLGGSHQNGYLNSGGGATLMSLNSAGLTVNGAFVSASDRNRKENFAAVNPREVLDKVTALPISRWNFKGDAGTPHVGPMAQDFHAAFALGSDDKHIATVDADGVALAAIQGLNQRLEETVKVKDARIDKLEKDVAELRAMVNSLLKK